MKDTAARVASLRADVLTATVPAAGKDRRRVTDAMLLDWIKELDAIHTELVTSTPAVVTPKPDPTGKCARTACFNEGEHMHRDTGLLYCTPCAHRINEACLDDTVIPVLVPPSGAS